MKTITHIDVLRALRAEFPAAIVGLVWGGSFRTFSIDGTVVSWHTACDLAF